MESKELSSTTVKVIKEWLSNCINEHSSCPRSPTPQLPRRVLDVGYKDAPVNLYQSQNDQKEHYATLSYCWGDSYYQVTTTTSNLEEHMLALPSRLPKTILDAIEVCRQIGIRYLWVDALCIIQDDESDKEDQIGKMGAIYKHSTVTLVAASASSSTEGFLGQGKTTSPTVHLPLFVDSSCAGTMGLRYNAMASHAAEPLFNRAWALQELLLSPRVLLFSSNQVMLRCMEYHFQPVPETHIDFSWRLLKLPASVFGLIPPPDPHGLSDQLYETGHMLEQHSTWRRIVEEYSGRDLTYFNDRLIALAGIASELSNSWKDVYLAGLWAKTIIQDLAWRGHTKLESSLHGEKRYLAVNDVDHTKRAGIPSWSWASAAFRVKLMTSDDDFSADAKMISYSVVPMSEKSPFGRVKEACLTLDAQVLMVSGLDVPIAYGGSSESSYPNHIWLDFEHPWPQLDKCRLLYLGQDRGNWRESHFLAIERLPDGEFHRVGYATFSNADTATVFSADTSTLFSGSTRQRIVLR
jgi:hypothetical protein